MHEITTNLHSQGKKWALVLGRFNSLVTEQLLAGARECLLRHGNQEEDITLVRVPGAFEIPLVADRLAASGKYDGVICLGAVIRGGTPHFDYVAGEAAKGIARINLDRQVPVIFGVLTTDSMEQALERAGVKGGNKGFEAAMAAIEMANLMPML